MGFHTINDRRIALQRSLGLIPPAPVVQTDEEAFKQVADVITFSEVGPGAFEGKPTLEDAFLNPVGATRLAFEQAGRPGMGFLSSIGKFLGGAVKTVTGIGKSLLGLGTAAAPAARRLAVPAAAGAAGLAAGALAFGGGGAPGAAGLPGGIINPATGEFVGAGGGNGVFTTITTVTTFNRLTGQAVKQRMFQGRPFLMQKEVAHLSSTAKKLMRGATKVPTRTRKPSVNSMITAAVKDNVLHQVQGAAIASQKSTG